MGMKAEDSLGLLRVLLPDSMRLIQDDSKHAHFCQRAEIPALGTSSRNLAQDRAVGGNHQVIFRELKEFCRP